MTAERIPTSPRLEAIRQMNRALARHRACPQRLAHTPAIYLLTRAMRAERRDPPHLAVLIDELDRMSLQDRRSLKGRAKADRGAPHGAVIVRSTRAPHLCARGRVSPFPSLSEPGHVRPRAPLSAHVAR